MTGSFGMRREAMWGWTLTLGGLLLAYVGAFAVRPEPGGAGALLAGALVVGGFSLLILGALLFLLAPRV